MAARADDSLLQSPAVCSLGKSLGRSSNGGCRGCYDPSCVAVFSAPTRPYIFTIVTVDVISADYTSRTSSLIVGRYRRERGTRV
ncbi:hypothetical protein BaRGS_00028855, partial [Batillaria attramentaria]